jgi:hypothetical protein
MRAIVKREIEGDARRIGGEQRLIWKLEEGNMLEVRRMKESRSFSTLSKGVSEPWPFALLVSTVSNNTQSLCISHPSVISS